MKHTYSKEVLDTPCLFCFAEPGEKCKTKNFDMYGSGRGSYYTRTPHTVRVKEAKEKLNERFK